MEGNRICFRLPSKIASSQKKEALNRITQSEIDTINISSSQSEFELEVKLDSNFCLIFF